MSCDRMEDHVTCNGLDGRSCDLCELTENCKETG